MAWKKPARPRTDNGVTQCFDDGIVKIYDVTDKAKTGYQPKPTLAPQPKAVLRYEERRLGIQRYYSAKQNQVQVERVLRVPRKSGVNNQDAAKTEDGAIYRIESVQTAADVYPPCMDVTLARYEQAPEEADDDVV